MARTNFPSDKQEQFVVRFPDGMRDAIRKAAEKNGRSMNAEIVHRLERSLMANYVLQGDAFEDGSGNLYVRQDRALTELNLGSALMTIQFGVDALQKLIGGAKGSVEENKSPDEKR